MVVWMLTKLDESCIGLTRAKNPFLNPFSEVLWLERVGREGVKGCFCVRVCVCVCRGEE